MVNKAFALEYNRDMTKTSSVGNLEMKLKMLEQQLNTCLNNFHDPLAFMTSVDSMIQSLRNYTFAVQANKSRIPNFDDWYGIWQERMKKDDYLRWLHNIRTDVVHKDVLTTGSHALLTLHPDHLVTIQTMQFDIMTHTKDMIVEGIKRTSENPEFKHSTAIIDRYYLCEVNGEPVETIHILVAAFDFMAALYRDLMRYLNDKTIHRGEIPQLKEFTFESPEGLSVVFKMKGGTVLNERTLRINRDDTQGAMEIAKKRYGEFKLKHDLKSRSYKEITRAHFEIAQKLFLKDGFHLPMIHYHSKKGWSAMSMAYTDRSEKILFWKNFGDKVSREGIDKIIFTTEAWTYKDLKKGLKHLNLGKEISTLRNKEEVLETYYIDKKGRLFIRSASITRNEGKTDLAKATERTADIESMPIFASIYHAWGLIDKQTFTRPQSD